MKSKNEFLEMVYALRESGKRIASKTKKAFYSGFRIEGDKLHFYREGPQTEWTLNIEDLWKVYCTQEFINTSVVKKVIGGHTNSPIVAILNNLQCIDENGKRI